MKWLLVPLAAVIALASACNGRTQTYSIEETKEAFAKHDFSLVSPSLDPEADIELHEGILTPRENDGGFLVFVATDAEADEAWPDYVRMQDEDSFDARRANVVVIADFGLSAAVRRRVLAALDALPDRGSPVEVAGEP